MPGKPLAVQFGEFAASLRFEDLPPEVIDKTKAFVNHALTVAIASYASSRVADAQRAVLLDEEFDSRRIGAGKGATVWVKGARATRVGAAFANAVAVATTNQGDSYQMLTHPGAMIIPAGIVTAEGEGRSGKELLTALAAGYEVQCRCARDFVPSAPAQGFRASPVFGILGTSVTTAKLMGLDRSRTLNALALAASFAGGSIEGQRVGAWDADFAEGQAARNGIWAANLAAHGFEGPQTALEGDAGFYYAFTGNNKGDLTYAFKGPLKTNMNDIVVDLGQRWELLDVKFKIYPTPGFNQAVIWLANEMMEQHRLTADDISRITLQLNYLETLYPSPKFPRGPLPDGSFFGRTRQTLAHTVVAGGYPVLERELKVLQGGTSLVQKTAAMQNRIEIISDFGRGCFSPRMTFALQDGRCVTGEYDGRELMWDFAKDALLLRGLIPGLPISPAQYDRLVKLVADLDAADHVDEVIRMTLTEG